MRKASRSLALAAAAMLLFACGGAPFASLGRRSSDWISEPTIVTTTTVPITVPSVIGSDVLRWFNDTIVTTAPLDNPVAVEDEIFARRAGDLFIQASRAEILAILPEIRFPATSPFLAEYVTSQIVFDNDGELSARSGCHLRDLVLRALHPVAVGRPVGSSRGLIGSRGVGCAAAA